MAPGLFVRSTRFTMPTNFPFETRIHLLDRPCQTIASCVEPLHPTNCTAFRESDEHGGLRSNTVFQKMRSQFASQLTANSKLAVNLNCTAFRVSDGSRITTIGSVIEPLAKLLTLDLPTLQLSNSPTLQLPPSPLRQPPALRVVRQQQRIRRLRVGKSLRSRVEQQQRFPGTRR